MKFTEEHRRKISESHKGLLVGKKNPMWRKTHTIEARKKICEATKKQFKEKGHPMLGKHHSSQTCQKISEALKGKKRPPISNETRKRMSLASRGRKLKPLTTEHKRKLSKRLRGNKNPAWRGGVTPLYHRIYTSPKYEEWRQRVFLRDDFRCQNCGVWGGNLHAHHVKPLRLILEEIKKNLSLFDPYEAAMIYSPLWDIENGITLCYQCHINLHKKGDK